MRYLVYICLLLLAVFGVALFALVRPQDAPSVQGQLLADGTRVWIEDVTFGTKHEYIRGSRLLVRLGPWLPSSLRSWLGARVVSTQSTAHDMMLVWYRMYDPVSNKYVMRQNQGFKIIDEHGCLFHVGQSGTGGYPNEDLHGNVWLPVFPRRQREFTLHASFQGQPPITLTVPNRFTIPFSNWVTEPLPATRRQGPHELTLSGISGHFSTNGHWFEPQFKVLEQGVDRTAWYKPRVMYEDPTGNQGYTLCPHEPAWKMNVDFYLSARAEIAETNIWPLKSLTVPTSGEYVTLSRKSMVDKVTMEVMALCGPGEFLISNSVAMVALPWKSEWSRQSFSNSSSWSDGNQQHFTMHFRNKKPTLILRVWGLKIVDELLIRVRDAKGKVSAADFRGSSDQIYRFDLEPSAGAERMDLEFIPHKPIHAEYIVTPPRPKDAK